MSHNAEWNISINAESEKTLSFSQIFGLTSNNYSA